VTLVISPLLALMKDQVDALCDRGVKAANLDSSLTANRSSWVKEEVLSGRLKLLYVAPERLAPAYIPQFCSNFTPYYRLNNEGFIEMMRRVKISLLAVDESHCISQVLFIRYRVNMTT
jgi:superfamily II DNA helicase RecQ